MTLMVDLAPELENQLREEANQEGIDPNWYAQHMLEKQLQRQRQTDVPNLSRSESELLQRINAGLSEETWRQYHALIAKRRAEALTPEQHQTLIALSDQVEMDYAQRLERVLQLARLRGTSLEAQMQALGIPQYTYE